MFYGREEELAELDALWRKGTSSLLTCRGRRRIGKSTLIEEFARRPEVRRKAAKAGQIAISVITAAEIEFGARKRGSAKLKALIAATAKQGDYILVTNNTDHFRRVPGLKVENWVKETV